MTGIGSRYVPGSDPARPLIVCIHGGGCNGWYFDLPDHSFRALAEKRGYPLLIVDRPGHGASNMSRQGLAASARTIRDHVEDVADRNWHSQWCLLGHSIGGAIAMLIAGDLRPSALRALAISGIGAEPMPAAMAWSAAGAGDAVAASSLLFGPLRSFTWKAPAMLRQCAEPWDASEVVEVLNYWPDRFADVARGVMVPLHLRLAEGEGIWRTGSAEVARLAALFAQAPSVDAALLPEGGHLYELHFGGSRHMAGQLDFFDRLA